MYSVFPCQTPLFWLRIIRTVQHIPGKLYTKHYLDAWLYRPGNVVLQRFRQPVARPCCGSSRPQRRPQRVPVATFSRYMSAQKKKGHSYLDMKSLLGPWWHWLWHAYQRTGCDVYAVEFILIRSCRRQWKEQLGCRGVREKVKGKKNLEIWLLSFIRNMQIGACKKGIIVECEFHHQVLPCMQMY